MAQSAPYSVWVRSEESSQHNPCFICPKVLFSPFSHKISVLPYYFVNLKTPMPLVQSFSKIGCSCLIVVTSVSYIECFYNHFQNHFQSSHTLIFPFQSFSEVWMLLFDLSNHLLSAKLSFLVHKPKWDQGLANAFFNYACSFVACMVPTLFNFIKPNGKTQQTEQTPPDTKTEESSPTLLLINTFLNL